MKYPNFNEEKKLWKQGFKCVVGLDEAGRGPLAGPVVAGAVVINLKHKIRNSKQIQIFQKIKDSKKMTAKMREETYEFLTNNKNIKWGVGIVSEKVIDKINILEATKLAMTRAIDNLIKKECCQNMGGRVKSDDSWFLLIDGNFKLDEAVFAKSYGVPRQKSIIKGDSKVFSISCASIIAKVTRDRIMQKYHKKYSKYGFDKHKGYGTKAHFENIEKFGPCKIHRKSFYPISNASSQRVAT